LNKQFRKGAVLGGGEKRGLSSGFAGRKLSDLCWQKKKKVEKVKAVCAVRWTKEERREKRRQLGAKQRT